MAQGSKVNWRWHLYNTGWNFDKRLIQSGNMGRPGSEEGIATQSRRVPLRHEFRRMSSMSKAIKFAEKAVTVAAQGMWSVFEKVNRISPNNSFIPRWSDKPLLKS